MNVRTVATVVALVAFAPLVAADSLPKVEWPKVDGFTRGEPREMNTRTGGYTIAYNSTDEAAPVVLTLYFYAGDAKFPNGGESKEAKAELDRVVEGLKQAKDAGIYKAFKETDSGSKPMSDAKGVVKAAWKRFDLIQEDGSPTVSEAYILGHKDHVVKLRVTYPADKKEACGKALASLLAGIGKALE